MSVSDQALLLNRWEDDGGSLLKQKMIASHEWLAHSSPSHRRVLLHPANGFRARHHDPHSTDIAYPPGGYA